MNKPSSLSLLSRTLNEGQLSWAIRFLFLISVFLIVILSFSYHSINQELVFYSERVDHSQQVLDKIHDMEKSMYEVTYYGRGYLIIADETNRRLMEKKLQGVPAKKKELQLLVKDNEAQILKYNVLAKALAKFSARVQKFAKENPKQFTPEQRNQLLANGTSLTSDVNSLLSDMIRIENKLMTNRLQSRNNYKQQIFRFNWVIMCVALAFLISAFILLERELKRNKLYKIELEYKVDNLNRSNSELEQFAYVASHDLQEPLRKIRSFTDLLLTRCTELAPESRMMLDKVDKSANRMQLLIDDLLSFSRLIDTTKIAEQIDLNVILMEVQGNLSESIHKTSAVIKHEKLPTITGYGSQMAQLFQNLISNSIKYSKEASVPVIDITCREVLGNDIPDVPDIKLSQEYNLFYCITFADNGIGFEKEYAERIFVIFRRLHGQEKFQGSGIGLAVCRKVVANHNGYIIAKGEEGQGAKFYVYLPKQTIYS
jgi:signal transduction histidine kinase